MIGFDKDKLKNMIHDSFIENEKLEKQLYNFENYLMGENMKINLNNCENVVIEDNISDNIEVNITNDKVLKIYCNSCKEHIYNMIERPTLVKAKDFKPTMTTTFESPKPTDRFGECQLCHKFFLTENHRLLTQRGEVNPSKEYLWE